MDRRVFISQLGLALSSCSTGSRILEQEWRAQKTDLNPNQPFALAMWDYSWLLRRYQGGGFENWDRALDQLVARGYNALRIDCFPQFIGKDNLGNSNDHYYLPKRKAGFTLWGNEESVSIQPRESLILFLTKCKERNIKIVLSSWFNGHGTHRNKNFTEEEGLIRAWNDTLQFLNKHNVLSNILYIDLLNEYPLWHGYEWLTKKLRSMSTVPKSPFDFLNLKGNRQFSNEQVTFYNQFIINVLQSLKKLWPHQRFMASQTNTLNTPWQDLNISEFDVLDIHQWMVYNQPFSLFTDYFRDIHTLKSDHNFKTCADKISKYWNTNKNELTNWLEKSIEERSLAAQMHKIPIGSTEGWGAVMWMDHKNLNWNFIKEAGSLSAKLGVKYGYSFNCSSNFTHPHFRGLWEDIAWHQEVTRTIRKL